MKDTKTMLLLVISVLLIIVSVFLLWTWTYRVNTIVAVVEKKDAVTSLIKTAITSAAPVDSLQKFYNSVLGNINKSIDSVRYSTDSLKGNLANKLAEFDALKQEIGNLLKNKLTDDDVVIAKQKIAELQLHITQLRLANSDVERENKRLNILLVRLSAIPTSNNAAAANTSITDTRSSAQRISPATDITTSEIRLVPMMETGDDSEQETLWAQQTSKFVASFAVKNNSTQSSLIEMVVVVTQPDGHVLQKSTWETGTFETRDGKKIYSYKDRSDYNSGEIKKLLFSVRSDRFTKGNYTMHVYNKGVLIARVIKSLS